MKLLLNHNLAVAIILLTIFLFPSCKKYEGDKYFSTYTAKQRLICAEPEIIWALRSIKVDNKEDLIFTDAYNFYLSEDKITFSITPLFKEGNGKIISETSFEHDWSLKENKSVLSISGVEDFKILKLTVNELELLSSKNELLRFEKKKIEFPTEFYSGFIDKTFYGLFNNNVTLSNLRYCEVTNDVLSHNCESINTVNGYFGKAIAIENASQLATPRTLTISNLLDGKGFVTFWWSSSDYPSISTDPIVTFDDNTTALCEKQVSFIVEPGWNSWTDKYWHVYRIYVPNETISKITISDTDAPFGNAGITMIDEIKFFDVID